MEESRNQKHKISPMDLSNTENQLANTSGVENNALSTHVNDGRIAVSADDLVIPYISVVNKMSELEIDASPGSLVYDKSWVLAKIDEPVTVVPVSAAKVWKEDIPFGTEGITPEFAYNEVAAAELTRKSNFPVITQARIGFVVLAPSTLNEIQVSAYFPFLVGEYRCALGQIVAQKRGYDATFKNLANAMMATGRPMWDFQYHLSGSKTSNSKGTWMIPRLKPTGVETPVALRDFARRMGGAK